MSSSERAGAAGDDGADVLGRRLAERLERAGEDGGDALSAEVRRRLLAALVRLTARAWLAERAAGGEGSPPFAGAAVSTEDVVVTAARMLSSAGVTTFELAALFDV